MHPNRQYHTLVIFLLSILWIQQTACIKEYSFEGRDSMITNDSIPLPPAVVKDLATCSLCKTTDELTLAKWNFKSGNTYFCGSVDNAGFIGTNNTFTFFGPSACSADTGLVVTVYLPLPFDRDMFDIVTNKVAFYYYDRNGTQDMFISKSAAQFSVLIRSFIVSTRIITGSFEGTVFKPNGDTAYVRSGNFKVLLR